MVDQEKKQANYDEIIVGERLGPTSYFASQESVDEYLKRITDTNPWYREDSPFGGRIAPPTYTGGDYVKLATTKYTSYDVVHTQASHEYVTPVKVGDTLTIEGTIVDKYIRRGRAYVVFGTVTTNQDGQVVVKSRNVWLVNASKKWPVDSGS